MVLGSDAKRPLWLIPWAWPGRLPPRCVSSGEEAFSAVESLARALPRLVRARERPAANRRQKTAEKTRNSKKKKKHEIMNVPWTTPPGARALHHFGPRKSEPFFSNALRHVPSAEKGVAGRRQRLAGVISSVTTLARCEGTTRAYVRTPHNNKRQSGPTGAKAAAAEAAAAAHIFLHPA